MSKREKIEKLIIRRINEMDKSGTNGKIYEDLFKTMNNKQFDSWVNRIGKDFKISIIEPSNSKKVKLPLQHLEKLLEKYGIEHYTRVYTEESGVKVLTPTDYNVMLLPIRRFTQHATSKINVAKHNKSRNPLTGQVTGNSKGSSIGMEETMILSGYGADKTLQEFSNIRGGNTEASRELENTLIRDGRVSLDNMNLKGTSTQAIKTLRILFKGMFLDLTK